ncbi:MAG: hypothetical protein Kow001_18360 [Acidobacteriota bacterium]
MPVAAWLIGSAAAFLIAVPAAAGSDVDELLRSADEILPQLAEIRGMPARSPLAKGVKSREEIRSYLLERLESEYAPEEVEKEARLLRHLGLIPSDLDLYAFLLELMTEQLAGYYDPFEETLYLADWLPPPMQRPVMAHELTHALQDQYFDLDRFMTRVEEDDDRTTARTAVFEGEALLTMLMWSLPAGVRDPDRLPDPVQLHLSQLPLMKSEYPVFASAPAYLQEAMLFPYAWGARFVQAFLRHHPWPEIGRLYRQMPESTEQILHPEKYLETPDPPRQVEIEDSDTWPAGFGERVYRNVLGEFALQRLLAQYLDERTAEQAAAGWDGDRVEWRRAESGTEALFLAAVWDSETDAAEFARAWRQAVDRRVGEGEWTCVPRNTCTRQVGGHSWRVQRSGDRVTVLEFQR